MKALVTGGAGLVGTSLCRRLLDGGATVFSVDNLVLGTRRHVEENTKAKGFSFEAWDVSRPGWHSKLKGQKFDVIFHLAANSDISLGHRQPEMDKDRTFSTTFETLQAARDLGVKNFVFSSTSAVYGARAPLPTPEECGEMHPVSVYGAGKLASEAFISAFVENYGVAAWVYRFGNVVGRRLTHGVIYDFTKRLIANPSKLEVLGNGHQHKTYIDVEDCVGGILTGFQESAPGKTHHERFQVFNLSTEGATTVRAIAEETVRVVAGGRAQIKYGDGATGWVGDVPKTSLRVARMKALGWEPKLTSDAAVSAAIRDHYEWARG